MGVRPGRGKYDGGGLDMETYAVPCRAVPRRAASHHATQRRAVPRAVPRRAVPRRAVPCRVVPYTSFPNQVLLEQQLVIGRPCGPQVWSVLDNFPAPCV
jgi:hypothetical protein